MVTTAANVLLRRLQPAEELVHLVDAVVDAAVADDLGDRLLVVGEAHAKAFHGNPELIERA